MDEHVRNVFLFEGAKQAEFGLNAHGALKTVLPRLVSGGEPLEYGVRMRLHSEVFRTIHSFLTHASNVSRLFWPSPARRWKKESDEAYAAKVSSHAPTVRADVLRAAAGLPEEHALRSRELRDHLEHFDERLDRWAASSKGKSIVQDLIGGPNAIAGIADEDMMRWYDHTVHSMRFQGKQYSLHAIADGLAEVHERCVGGLRNTGFAAAFSLIERGSATQRPAG